jgi:hypothetical protein
MIVVSSFLPTLSWVNACPIPGLWLGLVGRTSSVAPGTPPSVGVIVPSIIPAFVVEAVVADDCTWRYVLLIGVLAIIGVQWTDMIWQARTRTTTIRATVLILLHGFWMAIASSKEKVMKLTSWRIDKELIRWAYTSSYLASILVDGYNLLRSYLFIGKHRWSMYIIKVSLQSVLHMDGE